MSIVERLTDKVILAEDKVRSCVFRGLPFETETASANWVTWEALLFITDSFREMTNPFSVKNFCQGPLRIVATVLLFPLIATIVVHEKVTEARLMSKKPLHQQHH